LVGLYVKGAAKAQNGIGTGVTQYVGFGRGALFLGRRIGGFTSMRIGL